MKKTIAKGIFFGSISKAAPFKMITPILIVALLLAATTTPLYAQLTSARDLTGTWNSGVSGKYYEMDPSDGTMRMNDVTATFSMVITQQGNQISIVLNMYPTSWITDDAYWQMYGMSGVPPVGFGNIYFVGTVSGASFAANEQGGSSSTQEHLAGTFTTDIITATLTGFSVTSGTNGIVVVRSGSSTTVPPIATVSPTSTPTPALPTPESLASIAHVQGSATFADTGAAVTTQSPIGTGAEIKTGSNSVVGFNYPDQGGTVYLGANSNAGWVYLQPQTDPLTQKITYIAVPSPITNTVPFEEGLESDEFGQVAVTLPIEVGVEIGLLVVAGAPISLGGALVVEGTLLLGSGIAYFHEQMSQPDGTFHIRPLQVPQGMVIGAGTDYVVTVSNGSTTVQVIDGSVVFVDQYTNSSITVVANQMLTLPAGVQTGFSVQDLQSKLSSFDVSSIDQWWLQTTPTATPLMVTSATVTPTPTTNSLGATNVMGQPMFLVGLILVTILIVAAIVLSLRRKTSSSQPRLSKKSRSQTITNEKLDQTQKSSAAPSPKPDAAQPNIAFCPKCGNKLLSVSVFCPFCNSDLSQWHQNSKE